MIGKIISHYKITEKLGEGGMGVVYKAEDTRLNRTVALKFLPAGMSSDDMAKTRFINEAQAASAIDHPNICSIYEIGESDDGQSYIAMAYYDGMSLKEKLSTPLTKGGHEGVPIDDAISIIIQIAKGLARAHEEGIVHRDIKPANIMITSREEIKILDFGLAKLASQAQLTAAGATVGTAAYMSPEQATGLTADERSDIWAVGVVLYEMLTGRNPFYADYDQAIIYSIINETPEPIEAYGEFPDELQAIINKALAKDPNDRYASIEELLTAFEPLTSTAVLPKELSLKKVAAQALKKYKKPSLITVALMSILFILWLAKPYMIKGPQKTPLEIAVISFENMTGDPENEYLANFIPSLLRTALGQSNRVRVLTWDYLIDLLKQMDIRDANTIDREMGYQISEKAGISVLVTGSFAKMGNSFVTDVKVIDPATKDIIIPVSTKGEEISSILNFQIDDISQAILEGINVIDSTYLAHKKPVQEITTNSPEAYRYFVRAGEIGANNLSESIRYLERAVEIDSTFAEAHENLYELYWIMGPHEKCVEATLNAYRHVERAPDNGIRDMIYAAYAEIIEMDLKKYGRCLSAGLKKNPYNKHLWLNYAWYHLDHGKLSEAINSLEKAFAIDPENKDIIISACYMYAWAGDKTKTLEYIDIYMIADPGSPNTMATASDAYYILGMFEKCLEQNRELSRMYPKWGHHFRVLYSHILQENYEQARVELDAFLKEDQSNINSKVNAHNYRALFFYYMGEINRAFAELDSIRLMSKEHSTNFSRAILVEGFLLLHQDDIEGARQAFRNYRALPDNPDIYNTHRAIIYFKQGKLDSSRIYRKQALSDIEKLQKTPKFSRTSYLIRILQLHCDLLQGELLLASDSLNQAIDYYNEINFPTMYRAWVFSLVINPNLFYNVPLEKDIIPRALIKKGDKKGAIQAYEKMVKFQPGKKQHFIINPIYHYRLAKLYQQSGQKQKAIDRFRIFLDIWKYADDDLPQKQDAIRILAELDGN